MPRLILAPALIAVAALLAGCGAPSGRAIEFTASEQACAPAAATAAPGERLVLQVANESKGDRELEGIDGTRFEEVVIPAGKVRRMAFTMPESGAARFKCYAPGGAATVIEIAPAR
ncbi:MAG: hypothetical protein WC273_00105 [Dehalococcoidia bacterium]